MVLYCGRIERQEKKVPPMNLNEECLLKYLQNPDELFSLTDWLLDFNRVVGNNSDMLNFEPMV